MKSLLTLLLILSMTGCRAGTRRPTGQPAPPPTAVRLVCIDFVSTEAVEASAFFVTADGLLVTCAHVVRGTVPIGVTLPDGTDATVAELVASDPEADLALLRIGGSGFAALRQSDVPPEDAGALRAVTKDGVTPASFVGPHDDPEVGETILFSAPGLRRGASGGALVDGRGRVVGIIRGAIDDDPAEVIAVPLQRLRALLAEASEAEGEQ